MAKTATVNVRVEPEVKERAEAIYSSFGLSLSEAVNVFLHKTILEGGLPFDLRQPRYSPETEAAMDEAREILSGSRSVRHFASVEEMREAFDA